MLRTSPGAKADDAERLPPFDLGAEEALLGSILLDGAPDGEAEMRLFEILHQIDNGIFIPNRETCSPG